MNGEIERLAEKYHAGQFRDGGEGIPYITHPSAVVRELREWGEAEDSPAIAIAWGHDLLEDTNASEEEILAAAGERVLKGIKLLTRPEDMEKSLYIRAVAEKGDREALLVKLADRLCNSRDFVKLKGHHYALNYLHLADRVQAAVAALPPDEVTKAALAAWNALDRELREAARSDVVRGCMLGGAVGDALGGPVEFISLSKIKRAFGDSGVTGYVEFGGETGYITDDTQMALFTAEGLLRSYDRWCEKGICNTSAVVKGAYLRWLRTQGGVLPEDTPEWVSDSGWLIGEKALWKECAPGRTCITALEAGHWDDLVAPNDSKGCGTVMRVAPVGLFFGSESAYELGCEVSKLTHGHPTGITAGGAMAMLVSLLKNGKPLADAVDELIAFLDDRPDAAETAAALKKTRSARSVAELGEGWVAEEALAIGVYCALKHQWDFKTGVLEAVNIDGDSDSTGAITGNLLGAVNGENAIPEKWRKGLCEYDIVSKVADDLAVRFEDDPDGHATPEWRDRYPGY
jgi:ADP-ribosylglycohydrolase